jgi:hypothetical protein
MVEVLWTILFTFWVMLGIAQYNHEDLTVLFLDFEKAYDKFDWSFILEIKVYDGFLSKVDQTNCSFVLKCT